VSDYGKFSIQIVCHTGGREDAKVVTLMEQPIGEIKSILDLGLRHEEQIELLQKVQDQILALQSPQICTAIIYCPQCGTKLTKSGYKKSEFNCVFTDHKVAVQHKRCRNCHWAHTPSIRSEFGTAMHPDLAKLQCEMGASHTYRDAQKILDKKSCHPRRVNNHERILQVIHSVGDHITKTKSMESTSKAIPAADLIVQVDGGHLKDKSPSARSFEAMAAVVYRPDSVHYSPKTLIAAKKQGLTESTWLTALCDGAPNCWSVVDSLSSHCKGLTKVLDWFHISMKFKNIAVPEIQKKIFEKAKWHLWRGRVDRALLRLTQVIESIKDSKQLKKLNQLKFYIENNSDNIVDYGARKKQGLAFTSHLAESTVESLINQRCKGQQHMRWTREGVHPLLQLRAFIASNEWCINWQEKILGAMTKHA
jgi:protein-tyrosine-phosphatase